MFAPLPTKEEFLEARETKRIEEEAERIENEAKRLAAGAKILRGVVKARKAKAKDKVYVKREVGYILEHIQKSVENAPSNEWSTVTEYNFTIEIFPRNFFILRSMVCEILSAELPRLGYKQAEFELGTGCTLKLTLDWSNLRDEIADQDEARDKGNLIKECPVCAQDRPMSCLNPCGHMCCRSCHQGKCPICRTEVMTSTPLFNAMEDKSPFG